jgi:hypothetical protein
MNELKMRLGAVRLRQIPLCIPLITGVSSVGDPDTHVFGHPGSGSISKRYGSGSFPFFHKGVERTETMLAK